MTLYLAVANPGWLQGGGANIYITYLDAYTHTHTHTNKIINAWSCDINCQPHCPESRCGPLETYVWLRTHT